MNKTAVLHDAGQFMVPAVLVVGASLSTLAIVGLPGHPRPVAQPRPSPTVTVTAGTARVSARTTVTATARPASSPTSVRAAEPHFVAVPASHGRVPARRDHSPSTRPHPGGDTPSGPSPTPSPTESPAACQGTVLAVQLLRAACVSLGGKS